MEDERTVEEKILFAVEKGLLRIMSVIWFCLLFFLGDGMVPIFTTIKIAFENHLVWGMVFWLLSSLLFGVLAIQPLISIRVQIEKSRKENKGDIETEMG